MNFISSSELLCFLLLSDMNESTLFFVDSDHRKQYIIQRQVLNAVTGSCFALCFFFFFQLLLFSCLLKIRLVLILES